MLTREAVVEAAAQVLARDGYAGLTMRAIADALGVQAPAIYWYFSDKRTLELALYVHLMEGFTLRPAGGDWRDELRHGAQQLRAYLRGVRDITRLSPQGLWAGPDALSQVDETFGVLIAAGLSPRDTGYAVNMLVSFVFQWAAAESAEADFDAQRAEFLASAATEPPNPARYPHVAAVRPFLMEWNPDAAFAFRLDTMIAGLEARIHTSGA
jgi:TetR/AcrR family transcriptional regulator, tetracycline repressor protein